jgi:hypothetical protein
LSKHSRVESRILRKLNELEQLNKHAPLPSNLIELSESEIRRGLDKLAQVLTGAAGAAAAYQKMKLTDRERERLRKQGSIHPSAVTVLVDILADHPRANVREYRLAKLFEAVGSAAYIASYVVKNEAHRVRTVAANTANPARKKKTKRVITEELAKRGPNLSNQRAAELIHKTAKNRAVRKLKLSSLVKYVGEVRARKS